MPLGRLLVIFGSLCLLFTLIPSVLYGVFNVGVGGLGVVGVVCVLLPLLWNRWLARRRILRGLVLVGGSAAFLFCLVVSFFIAKQGWFTPPPESGRVAVIVLGGQINGDKPSLMLWRRLRVAADYMERNSEAVCVVSGGQGADEAFPEALVMRDVMAEMGIDPARIVMEDRSTNTDENLRFSRALTGDIDRAVIATDGFHQLRASIFAGRAGFREVSGVSSLTPWGLLPAYWLREIFGVSWAFVAMG